MKDIGIVGGGIVGLSCAYYLNKSGHQVTIIDQGDLRDGCSWGNAGMIVPSHIIPLAAPGMIVKGIRWMFNSSSPFYIRPRLNASLVKWGYQFYKSSTQEHVDRAIPALKEISLLSKAMYMQWVNELPFDFGYHERGLLMLYQTEETEKEELETARLANAHGVDAHVLSAAEVQRMEPDMVVKVRGGLYFPGDAHITPQQLVNPLISLLKTKGVRFQLQTKVKDFGLEKNILRTTKTDRGDFSFEELIIASGAWSGWLSAKLGLSLPLQAGKGYSFTLQNVQRNSKIPSIFLESRVAVTPMGNSLRFGGTLEITGINHHISMNKVKAIVDSIPAYYPEVNPVMPPKEEVWHGLRPCSPDGLPYIGRLKKIKNVILATGHSMMGMSLGPGTGKLVSEIINEEKVSLPLGPYDPERFD